MVSEGQGRAADVLVLDSTLHAEVIAHLRAELPNEGVGLLAATMSHQLGQVVATARRFYPGRNRRASPTRFDLDVRDLVAAIDDMDVHGWSLGGIVHSHPRGIATPSRTDLAEAYYPEALMMIVSFLSLEPDSRAWRLESTGAGWVPVAVPIRSSVTG